MSLSLTKDGTGVVNLTERETKVSRKHGTYMYIKWSAKERAEIGQNFPLLNLQMHKDKIVQSFNRKWTSVQYIRHQVDYHFFLSKDLKRSYQVPMAILKGSQLPIGPLTAVS